VSAWQVAPSGSATSLGFQVLNPTANAVRDATVTFSDVKLVRGEVELQYWTFLPTLGVGWTLRSSVRVPVVGGPVVRLVPSVWQGAFPHSVAAGHAFELELRRGTEYTPRTGDSLALVAGTVAIGDAVSATVESVPIDGSSSYTLPVTMPGDYTAVYVQHGVAVDAGAVRVTSGVTLVGAQMVLTGGQFTLAYQLAADEASKGDFLAADFALTGGQHRVTHTVNELGPGDDGFTEYTLAGSVELTALADDDIPEAFNLGDVRISYVSNGVEYSLFQVRYR
jgi:hypothetical protein